MQYISIKLKYMFPIGNTNIQDTNIPIISVPDV